MARGRGSKEIKNYMHPKVGGRLGGNETGFEPLLPPKAPLQFRAIRVNKSVKGSNPRSILATRPANPFRSARSMVRGTTGRKGNPY